MSRIDLGGAARGEPLAVPAGLAVRGSLEVPPSKSVSHRYLNLALLSGRPAVVRRLLSSEDLDLFLAALAGMGYRVTRADDAISLLPPARASSEARIDCGNAGTMYRFLTASLCALQGDWTLDGTPRLRQRPIAPLVAALEQLGAAIACVGPHGAAPLRIGGGSLAGGTVSLDASQSSQYVSALLMASCRARSEIDLTIKDLSSAPYIGVTLQALERFGAQVERIAEDRFALRPCVLDAGAEPLVVEGDDSAAAYPAAAAALCRGEVTLRGLRRDSRQGDRRFVALLAEMGAEVEWRGDELRLRGADLRALDADLGDIPDQVPTLAVLAPFAEGTTRIHNVAHLRFKESDRLAAVAAGLRALGVPVEELEDGLEIEGCWARAPVPQNRVRVDCFDDHRIAMSFAVLALRRPGVIIGEPRVVDKSYPGFWRDLDGLLE